MVPCRRVKDIVDEVTEGTECGVGVDDFTSWQEGDVLDCFLVRGTAVVHAAARGRMRGGAVHAAPQRE